MITPPHLQVCEHLESVAKPAGKRRRVTRNVGRPSKDSPAYIINKLKELAPPPVISSPRNTYTYIDHSPHLQCHLCLSVLDQPVDLGCDILVCASCCIQRLKVSDDATCPVCSNHNLSECNVRASSAVIINVLSTLKVSCTQCNRQTTASVLDSHMQSNCSGHFDRTPSVAEILSLPVSAPTLPVEKKISRKIST